jgi:hypothetical protein
MNRSIRWFLNMFDDDNMLDNNHLIEFVVIHEINDIQHVLDVHDNHRSRIDYRDCEGYFQQQDGESFRVYQRNLTRLVRFDQV